MFILFSTAELTTTTKTLLQDLPTLPEYISCSIFSCLFTIVCLFSLVCTCISHYVFWSALWYPHIFRQSNSSLYSEAFALVFSAFHIFPYSTRLHFLINKLRWKNFQYHAMNNWHFMAQHWSPRLFIPVIDF